MWKDGMALPFVSSSYALAIERLTFFASQYFFYCHILFIMYAKLAIFNYACKRKPMFMNIIATN
jgi:hypothetical protein